MTKSETQRAAEELMRAAGQAIRDTPGEPSEEDRILRAKLIMEEALETVVALGVKMRLNTPMMGGMLSVNVHNADTVFETDGDFDLIESVDGCCDLNVVVAGTLSALGVPDVPVQREVERSNRSKLLPDGTLPPHPTVEGKFGKGPGYTPPDIAGVIRTPLTGLDRLVRCSSVIQLLIEIAVKFETNQQAAILMSEAGETAENMLAFCHRANVWKKASCRLMDAAQSIEAGDLLSGS
jgi:predicted HAD superfamily Cof-like phosphohydrolase